MGDHGAVRVPCDQRWPFLAVRMPSGVVGVDARRHAAYTASHSVLSGWDLYATLRHLASGDLGNLDPKADWFGLAEVLHYRSLEVAPFNRFQVKHSVELPGVFAPRSILQGVEPNRSCEGSGIMKLH